MKRMKVLLVDDEKEFVSALAERLHLRGIEALTATDGKEALTKIEMDSPDLVVLDVLMPGLGGLDVLKRIRMQYPHIKVILLTGRGSTHEGTEGMRLGAVDCLMKPVKIEELIKKMQGALEDTSKGTTQQEG